MKTKRIVKRIMKFLEENKEGSTDQIYGYLIENMKHGTSMNALCNVLSKNKQFIKVRKEEKQHNGSRYDIIVWGLKGENENAMDRKIQTEND